MRNSIAPVVLLMLGLGACSSDVTAPKSSGLAVGSAKRSSAPSGITRPFSGTCELTFTPPPFPLPPVFQSIDDGTCLFTELGKTDFHGVQQINFAAGTQSGERTLTAANGDILRLTHVGTSTPIGPGLVRFRATATFVGGTGRFTNATGQIVGTGVANLATRTSVATFEGSITYDASDRRHP